MGGTEQKQSGCVAGVAFVLIAAVIGIVVYAVTSGDDTSTPAQTKPTGTTSTPSTWTFAGRTVVEDRGTGFTNGVPGPVDFIDQLANDCTALAAEAVRWREYAASNAGTETASNATAYAEYAETKRDSAGCP